jgi:hypothetical protein
MGIFDRITAAMRGTDGGDDSAGADEAEGDDPGDAKVAGTPMAMVVDFPENARPPDGEDWQERLAEGLTHSCELWDYYDLINNHYYTVGEDRVEIVRIVTYGFEPQYQVRADKQAAFREGLERTWEATIQSIFEWYDLADEIDVEVQWDYEDAELRDAILAEADDDSWVVTESTY